MTVCLPTNTTWRPSSPPRIRRRHQLRTIEADDPYDAIRKIANLPIDGPEGSTQVWVRVAIAFNKTDGSVRAALSVPVDASASDLEGTQDLES